MSRRNPPAKWVLPSVLHPAKTRCFKIEVPDEPAYIAAFRGALLALASGAQWQDDPTHMAREVALVWRNIYFNVKNCDGTPAKLHGTDLEEKMPIRIDCDCNVWVECCDGTEKQILTSAQVKALINGTTPGNAPQPSPGGCVTYHNYVTGLATELVPTPVSTGDTVEIQNIDGGTNGNNIARWNCGTGDEYFGGGCVGFPDTNASNRLPSVPTGTVIVNINGAWYDGRSIITVPGGVTNVQPVVALNYDTTYPASGTITYDVQVCNHATVTWCRDFNFALSPYGWIGDVIDSGVVTALTPWVSGSGFQMFHDPGNGYFADCKLLIPSGCKVTQIDIEYDGGTGGTSSCGVNVTGTPTQNHVLSSGSGPRSDVWTVDPSTPQTDVWVYFENAAANTGVIIKRITLWGNGTAISSSAPAC